MSAVPQVDWGTVFNVSNELTNNDLELVKEICRHTTSGLIATFKDYFLSRGINIGDDISVAIKILIPPDRVHELFSIDERNKHLLHTTSKLAVTFYRDSNTLRRVHSLREVGTTVYQVDQNTVLFHTIENPEASYYCNNLEKQGNYNNTNESWRRWYNAKLAVPIRTPCMGGGYMCFGVVDIDSLNKEKHDLYNDEECVDIVGHAADLLSIVFLSLARCKYGARRQSDAGANAASA